MKLFCVVLFVVFVIVLVLVLFTQVAGLFNVVFIMVDDFGFVELGCYG